MFMVNEIDKLLAGFLNTNSNNNDRKRSDEIKITVPDIKSIDVGTFNVEKKLMWQVGEDNVKTKRTIHEGGIDDDKLRDTTNQRGLINSLKTEQLLKESKKLHLTSDLLFISLMNDLLLEKLCNSQARESLSGSKILICDSLSHSLLLRLRRLLCNQSQSHQQVGSNLLFKKPFSFSAILTLSDVVDLFERQQKPLLYRRQIRGKGEGYDFNYAVVKGAFPYLKMTHLTLVFMDRGQLDFSHINVDGSREYLTLQMLAYFARSCQVIELKPLCKLLGLPHQIHNNILTIVSPDDFNSIRGLQLNPLNKMSLAQLVHMAEQLISLSDRLQLNLTSITHRQNDICGQSRAFAQFVGNKALNLAKNHIQSARVLVVDRFHSLRSAFVHADRYGAFLEQEPLYRSLGGDIEKLGVISQDKLDEKLQLIPLVELLSSIIEYTISLQPANASRPQVKPPKLAFGSGVAISRHLNIVRIVCNALNEGYLLLLRLESTLVEIANELANYNNNNNKQQPPTMDTQQRDQYLRQLGERVSRIGDAYKQLIVTSGKAIRILDLIRTGFILMDLINSYIFLANQQQQQSNYANIWLDTINELKRSLISGKQTNQAFKNKMEADEMNNLELRSVFSNFDAITNRLISSQQVTLDYGQTIANFQAGKLNIEQEYSVINLSDRKPSNSDVIIVVFVGPLTAHELGDLKILESKWKRDSLIVPAIGDLMILTSGLVKPEDIVRTLITND